MSVQNWKMQIQEKPMYTCCIMPRVIHLKNILIQVNETFPIYKYLENRTGLFQYSIVQLPQTHMHNTCMYLYDCKSPVNNLKESQLILGLRKQLIISCKYNNFKEKLDETAADISLHYIIQVISTWQSKPYVGIT